MIVSDGMVLLGDNVLVRLFRREGYGVSRYSLIGEVILVGEGVKVVKEGDEVYFGRGFNYEDYHLDYLGDGEVIVSERIVLGYRRGISHEQGKD